MVEILRRQRRPPILTPSAIPCLNRLPTINITQGCAGGCTYCYIQGYSNFPGFDRVILYDNTPQVLQEELRRRRRMPPRVFFSPSSDAFQDLPEVQEVSFRAMEILLDAGIEIAFLTKGLITPAFWELFRARPKAIHGQMGITTLDEGLSRALEPRAASPQQRLANIRQLAAIGATVTARLDPLVPDVTDTAENVLPLLASLKAAGVGRVSASYLFLRRSFARRVRGQIEAMRGGASAASNWCRVGFLGDSASGRAIGASERAWRFARLQSWAASHELTLAVCRCKNPEYPGSDCGISGPPPVDDVAPRQCQFDFV